MAHEHSVFSDPMESADAGGAPLAHEVEGARPFCPTPWETCAKSSAGDMKKCDLEGLNPRRLSARGSADLCVNAPDGRDPTRAARSPFSPPVAWAGGARVFSGRYPIMKR